MQQVGQTYQLKRSIRILHSADNDRSHMHAHSIQVSTWLKFESDGFIPYNQLEKDVDAYFARYTGQYLNDLPEFHGDANIEMMGEVFFQGLTDALKNTAQQLVRLEVGETSLRVFAIGKEDQSDEVEL